MSSQNSVQRRSGVEQWERTEEGKEHDEGQNLNNGLKYVFLYNCIYTIVFILCVFIKLPHVITNVCWGRKYK